MDVPSAELHTETETETFPLLMERPENVNNCEHIIDITITDVSSSNSTHDRTSNGLDSTRHEDGSSGSSRNPTSQPSTSVNGSNTRNVAFTRRGESRRRRSPLNSGLWISVELVLTLSQVVSAVVVLSVFRHEHPRAPLFEWIVGYAAGCVATLPLLYWRYRQSNQVSEPDSVQSRNSSARLNAPAAPFSIAVPRTSEVEDHRAPIASHRGGQNTGVLSPRFKVLVEYFKMALDCFFAVWFVVGNVWIFGGHSSAADAPNLYRLCIVFLAISCIGYAMPFILCATICCCLPCIVSILGLREDLAQTRGATAESIDALPTYKFKLKKSRSSNDRDNSSSIGDGGVVAAGTEKERVISGEDAVCFCWTAGFNHEFRYLVIDLSIFVYHRH